MGVGGCSNRTVDAYAIFFLFSSDPNPELGQSQLDRGSSSGVPSTNKTVRGAGTPQTGNSVPPHDPRAGPGAPPPSSGDRVRYNGGGGSGGGNQQPANSSNVKWGQQVPQHETRPSNVRGGHVSTKDKMR